MSTKLLPIAISLVALTSVAQLTLVFFEELSLEKRNETSTTLKNVINVTSYEKNDTFLTNSTSIHSNKTLSYVLKRNETITISLNVTPNRNESTANDSYNETRNGACEVIWENNSIFCDYYTQLLQYNKSLTKNEACTQALIQNERKNCPLTVCNECQTNISTLAPTIRKNYQIDIVVKLNGELGNHLFKLAGGKAIEFVAKEFNYPFSFKFHYLGQEIVRAKYPRHDITSCFPEYYNADFRECNVPSFKIIENQQNILFGKNASKLSFARAVRVGSAVKDIKNMLDFLLDSVQNQKTISLPELQQIMRKDYFPVISIPFIAADQFCSLDLLDRYHTQLRDFFTFNDTCCKALPSENETVLHIRGFNVELRQAKPPARFQELSPMDTAHKVLRHLKPGEKVVLLSRFERVLLPYALELQKRGIQVRSITGQTGVQDFCFLKKTNKEIVGMITSTYVFMSSFLNEKIEKVILYRTNAFKNATHVHLPASPTFHDEFLNKIYSFPVY